MRNLRLSAIIVVAATLVCGLLLSAPIIMAQVTVSPTPLSFILPTANVPATDIAIASPTPTWTATPLGAVYAALNIEGDYAIQSLPEPVADVLGRAPSGEQFVVTGQYFNWLQIEYSNSPTGRGWIYGEVMTIIGDSTRIEQIDPYAAPTADAGDADATATFEVQLQTPGAAETATAQLRVLSLPTRVEPGADVADSAGVLPTYTFPAELPRDSAFVANSDDDSSPPTATPSGEDAADVIAQVDAVLSGEYPRILPIALLGGFGLLGLFVFLVRR